MAAEASSYKLKAIRFFGREVPVVLQNDNGPCPLLAIANILLLRNQIQLPIGLSDVSQDRLISLVAGYLLDCNSEERLIQAGASAEYQANLHRNIADSIALLPKLTTGVDVNVKFHDFRAFEFTDEIAVFDLLDMSLVHGWLVDPQDTSTASILGDKTYNEIVSRLVTIMGDDTPKHLLATPASWGALRSSGSATAAPEGLQQPGSRAVSSPSTPLAQPSTPSLQQPHLPQHQPASPGLGSSQPLAHAAAEAGLSLDQEEAALLQEALSLSLSDAGTAAREADLSDSATSAPPSHTLPHLQQPAPPHTWPGDAARSGKDEDAAEQVQGVVSSVVDAAIQAVMEKGKMRAGAWEGEADFLRHAHALHSPDAAVSPQPHHAEAAGLEPAEPPQAAAAPSSSTAQPHHFPSSSQGPSVTPDRAYSHPPQHHPGTPEPGFHAPTPSNTQNLEGAVGGSKGSQWDNLGTPQEQSQKSEQRARELAEAEVISSFLESSSSQLTAHGLVSLQQGLRSRQLAVFFRNNHFNVVFGHDGQLLLLITDQGYLWEQDVVWERLCAVDGNTDFLRGDFTSFAGRSVMADALTAASLAQEAFSSLLPPAGAGGSGGVDADYALALQLQEEEVQRRRQAQQQQQQARGPGTQSPGAAENQRPSPQQQAQGRQSKDQAPPPGRQSSSGSRTPRGRAAVRTSSKEKGSGCKMM